jgi:hypothetical protein
VGVSCGVEAGEQVAAGFEAATDVAQDVDGLVPGEVVQREACDDRPETGVGEGEAAGEVYVLCLRGGRACAREA